MSRCSKSATVFLAGSSPSTHEDVCGERQTGAHEPIKEHAQCHHQSHRKDVYQQGKPSILRFPDATAKKHDDETKEHVMGGEDKETAVGIGHVYIPCARTNHLRGERHAEHQPHHILQSENEVVGEIASQNDDND